MAGEPLKIWKTTSGGADIFPADTAKWSDAEETGRQLQRFLVVGLLCVVTDLGVYTALANGISMSLAGAKAISYLAGVFIGFVLNKLWTFQSARQTWSEPVTYLLLYTLTLAVNVGCNSLLLSYFPEWKWTAFLFATAVTTVLNFLGMRLVIFRKGITERRNSASPVVKSQAA